MADKKISELTELTTPDGTEELVVNDSGVSKKITQANLFKLGDNVKAKFGASDDLQIYHDGSNSWIKDAGNGDLIIDANNLRLRSTSGKNYIKAYTGGATELYHNNALKLATTSTGIDVTGSVTCDGFTSTGIDDNATSTAITIDASENVGIGTSSPSATLDVAGTAVFGTGKLRDTGGDISINQGSIGLRINDASSAITATNGAGSNSDATIDLGVPSIRFKNLYLSGGVRLGGTGTANALDDYEEGTFTPIPRDTSGGSLGAGIGTYIKIGNMVHISITTRADTMSGVVKYWDGLPFSIKSEREGGLSWTTRVDGVPAVNPTDIFPYIAHSSRIHYLIGTSPSSTVTYPSGAHYLRTGMSGTYETA